MVGDSVPDHVLTITDEMTVGEFCHFFDYLFDGKAEVRIIHNKRRQFDEVPLKGFFNPNHAAELTLDSSMTVGEAEKVLSACFIEGCSVDIYPPNRCYRITKDMPLKDIKHLQAKLWDTFVRHGCAESKMLTTETILFSSDEEFKKLAAEAYSTVETVKR